MQFLSRGIVIAWLVTLCGMNAAGATPTFNLTYVAGTSVQSQLAFQAAANFWASQFTDTVSIDLTVGTGTLNAGVLAQAGSPRTSYSYNAVKAALASNATSATDASAVAGLPSGSSFSTYINYTSDNPNGSGSATPYVDSSGANNTTVTMTNANAKALGLTPVGQTVSGCASNCDAFIQFSTGFTYDYDRTNGITGGTYDFMGLAIHEIGHALGFVSGVDVLDTNSTGTFFLANQFVFVAPLDLFRCSAASAGATADLDFTANTATKNFSLDNCASSLGTFSTGRIHGDTRQASHWKDNLGLGVMDPTANTGELLIVTALDLTGFDAMGWEIAAPEPGTLALGGVWLAGMLALRRRRRAAL